ncbi:4Fe-4S binding protein [Candidatus Sumerlaeota bacterium]|nr:4Fe-4S binding protein [Candidatus Sumerlaeota bacterium]
MTTLTRRPIVEIDEEKCDGCGECVPACAEGAIQIINGKARLVAENLCDGMGACLGHCPKGAITVHEREADAYDESAVEQHLENLEPKAAPAPPAMPSGGCPGARLMQLAFPSEEASPTPSNGDSQPSALRQWPVQMMLVPPQAPFLQGADLLIAADCVPFAFADFHRGMLAGKRLLVGCPKLDDLSVYREKITQICEIARPKSITVAIMEVPCCHGLAMITQQAGARAGTPVEVKVIGIRGDLG